MRRVISVDLPDSPERSRVVQVVDDKGPGIYMMVVPAETVEDTLNDPLQFCSEGDIIIDNGLIAILRTHGAGRNVWQSWVSNILTAVLLVEFMVWSVDTVLWLGVQILQYPSALQSLYTRTRHRVRSRMINLSCNLC